MLRYAACLIVVFSIFAFAADPDSAGQGTSNIRVICRGQLRHGLVAMGAETTGTCVILDRMSWELKLPDEASRSFAAANHKQPVVVLGTLRRVAGTEIRARWIVDVERISKWDRGTEKGGAIARIFGFLRQSEDPDSELVIESDGIAWPLDLSHDPALPTTAKSLVAKKVILDGRIERAPGLELPPKTVVRVNKLTGLTDKE
jgi:hypothetical protein